MEQCVKNARRTVKTNHVIRIPETVRMAVKLGTGAFNAITRAHLIVTLRVRKMKASVSSVKQKLSMDHSAIKPAVRNACSTSVNRIVADVSMVALMASSVNFVIQKQVILKHLNS